MISSSKKGQASYSQAGSMGVFSRSFSEAMDEIASENSTTSATWPNLFRLISQKTVQRAAQLKISQNPQWMQGIYSSGTSTVYQPTSSITTSTTKTTTTTSTGYIPFPRYRKPWNSPEEPKIIGLSLGYVSKQWSLSQDGTSKNIGYWDDKNSLNGLQVGIRIEPQFKY